MKAAVIVEPRDLQLKEVPMPELKEGEALIKVKYCGICGSDIHVLNGEHATATFPRIPGHEFVGELVEAKGAGSERFQPGDLVVAQPFFSCGNCDPCSRGQDNVCKNLCFVGIHREGGFAQYVVVLTRKMYKINGVTPKLAALTEPLAVAIHDVRRSGLKVGQAALIIGGGPIGMLIAMVARQAGAGKVLISEISQSRREFAENLGFKTIDPLSETFDKEIMDYTSDKGFDVVYEVSGSKPGLTTAVQYAAIGGTIMIVGMSSQPYPIQTSAIFAKELTIQGVRIHGQINFVGAVEMLKSGVINKELETLISKVYSIDDVVEAFEFAKVPGDYFKVLVEM